MVSILWLRLGLRQVVETTDTKLPLWSSEDGAQEMVAVLESSSLTLTPCGRSRSSSNSSPLGPGTHQDTTVQAHNSGQSELQVIQVVFILHVVSVIILTVKGSGMYQGRR